MSGGTLRGEDKKMKKLKSFFDKNASLSKRWKSLLSYSGEFLFILLQIVQREDGCICTINFT